MLLEPSTSLLWKEFVNTLPKVVGFLRVLRGFLPQGVDTLRLTFTSNVKPLAKFLILQLYCNGFYKSFKIY